MGNILKFNKSGKGLLELLENAYYGANLASKNKNEILETSYINVIKTIVSQIIIKYIISGSEEKKYKRAKNVFDKLIYVVENDDNIEINNQDKIVLYEFLNLDSITLSLVKQIVNYNDEVAKSNDSSNDITKVGTKESIIVFEELLNIVSQEIKTNKETLGLINSIEEFTIDENSKATDEEEKLTYLLLFAETNKELKDKLIKLFDIMQIDNPKSDIFKYIKPTYKLSVPLSNKVIDFPRSNSDIIYVLNCYKEFLISNIDYKVNNHIKNVLLRIIGIIYNTKNLAASQIEKGTIAEQGLKDIIKCLKAKKKIVISNRDEFLNANLGILDNAPKKTLNYLKGVMDEIDEYNVEVEQKEILKRAKTIRTSVINKLKSSSIEDATKLLEERINAIDDEQILRLLEKLFDNAVDDAYNSGDCTMKHYSDLCDLALDCSVYNRKKKVTYAEEDQDVIPELIIFQKRS